MVFCDVRRDYCDALDSAHHVSALAGAVIYESKRIVVGLQERASAAHPNKPAFDRVVLAADSVYRELGIRVLVEVHPDVLELVVSDGAA